MRSRWLGFVIVGLTVAGSMWAYPRLPPMVATHWTVRGVPDGYSPRLVAAVFLPAVLVLLIGVAHVLFRAGRTGSRFGTFAPVYWPLVNALLLFLATMHMGLLGNGVGAPLTPTMAFPVGLGLVLVVIGAHLGRVRPNALVGIRTPWTLASEAVWVGTHRVGGWLFGIGGVVVMVVGLIFRGSSLMVAAVATAILTLVVVVLSYVLHRRAATGTSL